MGRPKERAVVPGEEGMDGERLRRELRNGDNGDLWRRRASGALSLAGMASMAAVSLYQIGVVRHLPDPPIAGFDSDRVNASPAAYQIGVPDGTLALASFAAKLPLAALGGADRAQAIPLVPLVTAAKAAVEAVVAGWYFYQMPTKEKAWCGYCITGALASFGVFALSLPEARAALTTLRPSKE